MENYTKKENIFIVTIMLINILFAYLITYAYGVTNVVLYESYSATGYMITYEVLIWYTLSIIESVIFEIYRKKKQEA